MSKNLFNLFAVFLILFVITACVCNTDRNDKDKKDVSTVSEENKTDDKDKDADDQKSENEDKGDFIVENSAVENPKYEKIDQEIREDKTLEKAADQLNRELSLPNDIFLRTKDCKEINAYYDSRDQSVTVCYELMEYYFTAFKSAGLTNFPKRGKKKLRPKI